MTSYVHDLKFYLSGGAANTDPAASLGGAISTTQVASQSITTSTITGITYDYVAGCAEGAGVVNFLLSGTLLSFQAPGEGGYGPSVNVNTNGTYTLRSMSLNGYLVVTKNGSLPGGNTSQNVTIGQQANKVFDDVLAAEAVAGRVEYRCIYLKNGSGTDSMTDVKLWIEADTAGEDTIEIGKGSSGAGGTEQTVTNETTAPTSVTFSTALGEANALLLQTLTTGQAYPIWIKRTVPANSLVSLASDVVKLRARFK